ncbi:unnamed protein product [Leptosia nina]|uniref:Integrase catalytic domain-containing protein n=1 Tax=Leptosia nina TaxID=320188 RepID=A0AAV1IVM5_9NEOP
MTVTDQSMEAKTDKDSGCLYSAYWPQQNGEVERQNKSIEKKDLQDSLNDFLKMYNSTPHSVTGKTPTKLFYKRQNLEAKIKNKKREEKNTETKEERHRMWI